MNEIEEAQAALLAAFHWLEIKSPASLVGHLTNLIRAVMAEGQGGERPTLVDGKWKSLPDQLRAVAYKQSDESRAPMADGRTVVRISPDGFVEWAAADAIEALAAQLAAVRAAAKPFLEAVELADLEARPGVFVFTNDLRALRAALAASPDNAKQDFDPQANLREVVENAKSPTPSDPTTLAAADAAIDRMKLSEPTAQGRALKVGDRVRDAIDPRSPDAERSTGYVTAVDEVGRECRVRYDSGVSIWRPFNNFEPLAPSLTGELVKALAEADRLYSSRGLIANDINCGKWINNVRDLLTRAEKENQP